MEYRTEFSCKKAIIVDEKMLKEIEFEIKEYCDVVEYNAELENTDRISFESLEELIIFENSKINKIKSVSIAARDSNYINKIDVSIQAFDVLLQRFYETISVEMKTDSLDKKTLFTARMENIFNRHEQSLRYNVISKTGIFSIVTIVYVITFLTFFVGFISNGFEAINKPLFNILIVLSVLILIKKPLQKLREKYYPPIVFYLGDFISIYDKYEKTRENIFWGGIVAIILGIVFLVLELFLSK